MLQKKFTMSLMAMSLIVTLLLGTSVFAAEDTTPSPKKENIFVGWFHKFVQRFSFNFKKENSPKYSFGDVNNPSGTPMAKPITDEERLTKLVANGKITEAQKTAILAELTTLKTTYGADALKGLTEQERMKKLQEMRTALKTWAKAQGIEIGFVMPEIPGNGQGQPKPNDDKDGKQEGGMKRPSGTPKPIEEPAE